jgi:flagellar hook assembly protein FlgD
VPDGGAPASIHIYDVSGRLIRIVVDDYYGGGTHEAVWDGRSRAGSQVGSGVYFCLARIGEWTDRSKVLIAR